MNVSRLSYFFLPILFSLSSNALTEEAPNYSAELSICAVEALGDMLSADAVIYIDISEVETENLRQSLQTSSLKLVTWSMSIDDNLSGEPLGDLICVLDYTGKVVESRFDSELNRVASN